MVIAIEKDKLSLKIRILRMKNPEGREGNDSYLPNTDVTCGMLLFLLFSFGLPFCFSARLYLKPDKPLVLIRNSTQQNG